MEKIQTGITMASPIDVKIFTEGKISLPYTNLSKKKIKSITESAVTYLDLEDVSIAIILTDDEYITSVNKEYRHKDKATDVISFAYRENPFPEVDSRCENLGDIYISLEKAQDQAKDYGVSFIDEMKRLIIHGILHLTGMDHEKSVEEAEMMRTREEELFNNI